MSRKPKLTEAEVKECEAWVVAMHNTLIGKTVKVRAISGWTTGQYEDTVNRRCDPPIHVRIEKTANDDLCRWLDGHLDPFYDVTPLEPERLDGCTDLRSCWIYGHGFGPNGEVELGDIVEVVEGGEVPVSQYSRTRE